MEGVSLDKFFSIFWIFSIFGLAVQLSSRNFASQFLHSWTRADFFAKKLLRLLFWYFNYLLVLGINFEALLDIRWLWRSFKNFESNLLILHPKDEFFFFYINQSSSRAKKGKSNMREILLSSSMSSTKKSVGK